MKSMLRTLGNIFIQALVINTVILSITLAQSSKTTTLAPVSGFASAFLTSQPIANAKITVLETGEVVNTDKKGKFGPILYPVGKPITLVFEKRAYKTTQSATVIVPKEGLNNAFNNISFQIPSLITYHLLAYIIGAHIDDNSCHVTTTITAYHKILSDIPQGEGNAKVILTPAINEKPFYFDIFKFKLLAGKTNPFTKGLTSTSEDGGVAFANLPVSDTPYTISAMKDGTIFTSAQFICRKGSFINISPPRGPMAMRR